MNPFETFVNMFMELLAPLKPFTASQGLGSLLILGFSLLMGLLSIFVNKLIMNEALQRQYMKEFSEYKQLLEEYKLKGDKKILIKMKKKEPIIRSLSTKVFTRFIIRIAVFWFIFWIFFSILYSIFGSNYAILIPFPFETPVNIPIWYTICVFASNLPISKLMGISFIPTSPEVASSGEKTSGKT
ncbi:MAG: EMC3/TMCO1 family protein [Candidatus Bathyarchaeia archaeon]